MTAIEGCTPALPPLLQTDTGFLSSAMRPLVRRAWWAVAALLARSASTQRGHRPRQQKQRSSATLSQKKRNRRSLRKHVAAVAANPGPGCSPCVGAAAAARRGLPALPCVAAVACAGRCWGPPPVPVLCPWLPSVAPAALLAVVVVSACRRFCVLPGPA